SKARGVIIIPSRADASDMGEESPGKRRTGWYVAAGYIVLVAVLPLVAAVGRGSLSAILGALVVASSAVRRGKRMATADYERRVSDRVFWILYGVLALPVGFCIAFVVTFGGVWEPRVAILAILVVLLAAPLALPWARRRRE